MRMRESERTKIFHWIWHTGSFNKTGWVLVVQIWSDFLHMLRVANLLLFVLITGANYLPASLNNSTSSLASLPNASSNHVSTSYHHPYPSDLHPHHHHRHQHHQHQSVTGRSYTAASRYTSPPTRDRDVSVGGKVNSYHSANPQLARRWGLQLWLNFLQFIVFVLIVIA